MTDEDLQFCSCGLAMYAVEGEDGAWTFVCESCDRSQPPRRPAVMVKVGDRARTPEGWAGRVEAVLVTGKAVVAHPDTGLAWWFPIDDIEPLPDPDESGNS